MVPTLLPVGRGQKKARRPEGWNRGQRMAGGATTDWVAKEIQVYSLKLVVGEGETRISC